MPTPNPPQDDKGQQGNSQSSIRKVMPSGPELHDALMGPIEKDLTTENLQLLDEKYADESDAERVARSERYRVALQKYDIAFSAWVSGVNEKVDSYKQTVLRQAEKQSGKKDAGELSRLESAFSEEDE